jgi:hypothetical protein
MAKTLIKEETHEEMLDRLVAKKQKEYFVKKPGIAAPTHRNLYIGERVRVGNLQNCKVVKISDDQCLVVVQHNPTPTRDNPNPPMYGYLCVEWPDAPPEECSQVSYSKERVISGYTQSTLDSLLYRALKKEIRDNPDYQRGYVWTVEDKQRYVDSALRGVDLGKFVFVSYPYPDNEYEVLDGKQRLSALVGYMAGEFTYNGLYYWELSHKDRYAFEGQMVQFVDLNGARISRRELLELFLQLNCAGVPQTEQHLDYVRDLLNKEILNERK